MTRARNWIVVLLAAVLATGAAVVGRDVNHDEIDRACAGVEIETETSGRTPDEAFAAYIESVGGQRGEWESGAEFSEHGYRPVDYATAQPNGFSEIHVDFESEIHADFVLGIWRVNGACR